MRKWLLPEYIDDINPSEVSRIEKVRRSAIDQMQLYGYVHIMPPMVEYLDSLLTGATSDLDRFTFKLVDQLSGKSLGVRADMTVQAARIDAHVLSQDEITRLCYSGSVLHTVPKSAFSSRESLQIGAEIFGVQGIEADLEVQKVMLEITNKAGLDPSALHIVLGHQGILRGLIKNTDLSMDSERTEDLFLALKNRDRPGISDICKGVDSKVRRALIELPTLTGDPHALSVVADYLPDIDDIHKSLKVLREMAKIFHKRAVDLSFDFVDVRGFEYHTGLVFSLFVSGENEALGWGGRYDDLGKSFGRARSATGFSMNLRKLSALTNRGEKVKTVVAPYKPGDLKLIKKIEELRESGLVVVQEFGNKIIKMKHMDVVRLVHEEGDWVLK